MNQILQIKEKSEDNNENIKKMTSFLIIFFIIFGLIIGVYYIYQNIIKDGTPDVPEYIPMITLKKTEEDKLIVNIESEIGLSSVTYNWNNEASQKIDLEGKTNIEKELDIPIGENTIYISVIDINQKETLKEEKFTLDLPRPVIDLSVVGNNIKILVTSEIELAEIIYQWNSETVKKENMITYENKLEFEKQLEIPIGKNTLTVIATDINENKTEKVQEIKGVTKATTKVNVDGEYWHFTVTGKENIKIVEFEFNGAKYVMTKDTFGETKTVHYKVKLVEGKNYLNITSTTESDGVDKTSWEQEYTNE